MAGSLNRVTIIGNVGKDPESKAFQNGGKVVNFSVATSETWKDKNSGEKREKTEWHTVAVFQEGLVGVVEQYVRKGSKVMVEGKMQTRKWQDQQGQDRYTTEIVLQGPDARILLLGDKAGGERGNQDYEPPKARTPKPEQAPAGSFADLDDDVPF